MILILNKIDTDFKICNKQNKFTIKIEIICHLIIINRKKEK